MFCLAYGGICGRSRPDDPDGDRPFRRNQGTPRIRRERRRKDLELLGKFRNRKRKTDQTGLVVSDETRNHLRISFRALETKGRVLQGPRPSCCPRSILRTMPRRNGMPTSRRKPSKQPHLKPY